MAKGKLILSLDNYKVIQMEDEYIVENHITGMVEYSHKMLPTVISTAESMDRALNSIISDHNLEIEPKD